MSTIYRCSPLKASIDFSWLWVRLLVTPMGVTKVEEADTWRADTGSKPHPVPSEEVHVSYNSITASNVLNN